MQHLNPNGIQHLAAFVALCEGYLGIGPHFDLWKYFFVVTLQRTKGKSGRPDRHWPMGCVGIHLRNNWVGRIYVPQVGDIQQGMAFVVVLSQELHHRPLPVYTGGEVLEARSEWKRGVPEDDLKNIENHLAAI